MNGKKEFGDYQTPLSFALKICTLLKERRNINPRVVLEPTCGVGNFLKAAVLTFDAEKYYGIEINPRYCELCREFIKNENVTILNENFLRLDSALLPSGNDLLILGNPPWANNSELSKINSDNLPEKINFKNLSGLEAMSGASNFDICEYVILKILQKYRKTNAAVAMLCKTSVARNIFKELIRQRIAFFGCEIVEFDADKIFGVNVDAGLLLIQLSEKQLFPLNCSVYDMENLSAPKNIFGYRDGKIYSNLSAQTCDFDGKSCFEWRQGIKHDCAKVMELTPAEKGLKNGADEIVDLEDNMIFPLVKSSAIKTPIINKFSRYVVVTQKKIGEDTSHLEADAPKTWRYLNKNSASFNARKSRIYNGAPKFAMFGIGDYSYAPYKVCVSGFAKTPLFSVAFSSDYKPVMLDDTCYFICFETYELAYAAMLYLNSEKVQAFLRGISFSDSKRPYTKKILERIDFSKICSAVSLEELIATELKLKLERYIVNSMLEEFKAILDVHLSLF